jgi:hypothetical protein
VTRRLVDVAVVLGLAITAALAVCRARPVPPMAAGLCADTDGMPRIGSHVSIAAVFSTIEGPDDVARWSLRTLGDELVRRGFTRESPTRYRRFDAIVELVGPLVDDVDTVEAALDHALANFDLVYFNGHNFAGEIDLGARAKIMIFDSCYSAQYYGELAGEMALIANTERAITGSVYGFVDLLDGLLARDGRSWRALLGPVNAAARARAALREGTEYETPERYGLVGKCHGQAPADEP